MEIHELIPEGPWDDEDSDDCDVSLSAISERKEKDDHTCTDWEWFNPDIHSNDDMDEVLACTECGKVKWTAREIAAKSEAAQ